MNYILKLSFVVSLFLLSSCGNLQNHIGEYRYRSIANTIDLNAEETRKIYETVTFRELLKDVLFELDHFDGTISLSDLVKDRVKKIEATYRRLIVNDPHRRNEL